MPSTLTQLFEEVGYKKFSSAILNCNVPLEWLLIYICCDCYVRIFYLTSNFWGHGVETYSKHLMGKEVTSIPTNHRIKFHLNFFNRIFQFKINITLLRIG